MIVQSWLSEMDGVLRLPQGVSTTSEPGAVPAALKQYSVEGVKTAWLTIATDVPKGPEALPTAKFAVHCCSVPKAPPFQPEPTFAKLLVKAVAQRYGGTAKVALLKMITVSFPTTEEFPGAHR
jgi:hypothetical protein